MLLVIVITCFSRCLSPQKGLSIGEFLKIILGFFLESENLHLLKSQNNTEDYMKKRTAPSEVSSDIGTEQAERIWQEDLANLVAERDNSLIFSSETKCYNSP